MEDQEMFGTRSGQVETWSGQGMRETESKGNYLLENAGRRSEVEMENVRTSRGRIGREGGVVK
jgi:hypothetical protein